MVVRDKHHPYSGNYFAFRARTSESEHRLRLALESCP